MSNNPVVFIGLSHVGLVSLASWASLGNYSLGLDTDNDLVNDLSKGKLTIWEPGLDDLIKKNRSNFSFSSDFSNIKDFKVIFITHDTELTGNNRLEKLNFLIENMLPNLANSTTIILMSQVPVGYCRELSKRIKKFNPKLKFTLVHWIDTIIMTKAIDCFLKPTRIVLGFENSPYKIPMDLKNVLKFFSCPILYISWESAEIVKAATNVYLATTVTFANTISDLCEATGANMNEAIPALRLDRRIGQFAYLRPSPRIAGGHIERDLEMFKKIAHQKKIKVDLIGTILNLNEGRYKWITNKLKNLNLKKNPNICIWGLAYKKNSDSTVNAPSLKIIQVLSGKHNLKVYDPQAVLPKKFFVTQYKNKYTALKDADCLIILTEWDDFEKADAKKMAKLMRRENIIDCVGILQSKNEELKRFNYISMGVGK